MTAFKVQDPVLIEKLKKKVDAPLQLLFVMAALTPFAGLVRPPLGGFLVLVAHVVDMGLLLHVIIQIVDIAIFNWYLQRKQAKVASVVRMFVLSVLYLIGAMLLLDWAVGVSVLPILATSTVLTAVFGLALQDTLKNVFAGLNMSLESSFEQGDWVLFKSDSNDALYGQIVEIGWRTTKVHTLNDNFAIIPNSKFTNHELVNFSKPTNVSARALNIPVSLTADPNQVASALTRSVVDVEGVLKEPPAEAVAVDIKPDHAVFQLRYWSSDGASRDVVTGAVLSACWQELRDMKALPKQ